jgi:hypothetical protein
MMKSWIERMLVKKYQITQHLHLGTEFEYTRFVDKKGNCIDPFVPQSNVSTLQRALEKLLSEADKPAHDSKVDWDKNHPGELNYAQFFESFKDLPYDLTSNDKRMLLAIADESPHGAIDWKEFIPVGIDAIKQFLARNKLMQKGQLFSKELETESMTLIFEQQAKMAAKYLTRKFKQIDYNIETKKHSGFVTFKNMQEAFRTTSLLTTKESNLLLREYVMKHGYDKINYTQFEKDLLDVRLQLLNNRTSGLNILRHPADELLQKVASSHDKVTPQMTI